MPNRVQCSLKKKFKPILQLHRRRKVWGFMYSLAVTVKCQYIWLIILEFEFLEITTHQVVAVVSGFSELPIESGCVIFRISAAIWNTYYIPTYMRKPILKGPLTCGQTDLVNNSDQTWIYQLLIFHGQIRYRRPHFTRLGVATE